MADGALLVVCRSRLSPSMDVPSTRTTKCASDRPPASNKYDNIHMHLATHVRFPSRIGYAKAPVCSHVETISGNKR